MVRPPSGVALGGGWLLFPPPMWRQPAPRSLILVAQVVSLKIAPEKGATGNGLKGLKGEPPHWVEPAVVVKRSCVPPQPPPPPAVVVVVLEVAVTVVEVVVVGGAVVGVVVVEGRVVEVVVVGAAPVVVVRVVVVAVVVLPGRVVVVEVPVSFTVGVHRSLVERTENVPLPNWSTSCSARSRNCVRTR